MRLGLLGCTLTLLCANHRRNCLCLHAPLKHVPNSRSRNPATAPGGQRPQAGTAAASLQAAPQRAPSRRRERRIGPPDAAGKLLGKLLGREEEEEVGADHENRLRGAEARGEAGGGRRHS